MIILAFVNFVDLLPSSISKSTYSASVRGGSSSAIAPLDFEKVEITPLIF